MATAVMEPPAERIDHPHKPIENVPGRLGLWPTNVLLAQVGLPWKRRLSKAALMVPAIRYWERRYLDVSDEQLLQLSMELRGKARGGHSLDRLLPQAFGLCSVSIQRVLGIRPFD